MTIEEAPYTVVEKQDAFEIRDYAPHVVAETVVEREVEEAGNKAFNNATKRNWNHGSKNGSLLFWASPRGPDTTPPSSRGSCGATRS